MPRLGWVFALLVLVTFGSRVHAAVGHTASRIELNDGTVFTNVTFRIDTV